MVQWLAHWTLNPIIRVQFSVCPFLWLPVHIPRSQSQAYQGAIQTATLNENILILWQLSINFYGLGRNQRLGRWLLAATAFLSTNMKDHFILAFLLAQLPFSLLIPRQRYVITDRAFLALPQHQFYYMERVLYELQLKTPWKEAMRKCCRTNKLNVDLVSYFTPLRFKAAYAKFQKIYEKKAEDRTERWLQNQLKAFYWICVAVSCVAGIPITQFGETQWRLLHEIFYCKTEVTLEYEAKKLIENIASKCGWGEEEDEMLTGIVSASSDHSNKWNEFARKLYEDSQKKFLRTGKQCRERWLNHLDPSKKHGEWTAEEDKRIVELLLSTGKRWSKIAKKLGSSRTEHMIKNRYKTIISKQKKLYPHIKLEEQLIRSYAEPSAAAVFSKAPEKEVQIMTDIKSEHKSENISEQPISSSEQVENEEGLDFNVNQFVVEEQNKNKLPSLNPPFDVPQVYSPWYVSIPMTPTFSPSVPFFVNFSTSNFQPSFDSSFANQFYCPKKPSDSNDHF